MEFKPGAKDKKMIGIDGKEKIKKHYKVNLDFSEALEVAGVDIKNYKKASKIISDESLKVGKTISENINKEMKKDKKIGIVSVVAVDKASNSRIDFMGQREAKFRNPAKPGSDEIVSSKIKFTLINSNLRIPMDDVRAMRDVMTKQLIG